MIKISRCNFFGVVIHINIYSDGCKKSKVLVFQPFFVVFRMSSISHNQEISAKLQLTELQSLYIYYFSNMNMTKNLINKENTLYKFASAFNFEPIPRETIIRTLTNNTTNSEILIAEMFNLHSKINLNYFHAAQYEIEENPKDRTTETKFLVFDLMRCLIAFEYQFRPEYIATSASIQACWRKFPYVIKLAVDFPPENFNDFLFIMKLIVGKINATFDSIVDLDESIISIYTAFISSLIQIASKSLKESKFFGNIYEILSSHFKEATKDAKFFNFSLKIIAEFLLCLKNCLPNHITLVGDSISNSLTVCENILVNLKGNKGEEWFSIFCLVMDAIRIILVSFPEYYELLDGWFSIIFEICTNYFYDFNSSIKRPQKIERKQENITTEKIWFTPSGTISEFVPLNIEIKRINTEPHAQLLINSLSSIVISLESVFNIFMNYMTKLLEVSDAPLERCFLAQILQMGPCYSIVIARRNFLDALMKPNLFASQIFEDFDSIEYYAFTELLSFINFMIKNPPQNITTVLCDYLAGIFLVSDPITYRYFASYILTIFENKNNIKYLTAPILYDSLFQVDAKYRTFIINNANNNDNNIVNNVDKYKRARATLIQLLKICLKQSFSNTLFFCNHQRSFYFLDLIFEQDTKNFAIEAISSSLSVSKAPFSLLNSISEWFLSNKERFDDSRIIDVIITLLQQISLCSMQNTENIRTGICQSNLDQTVCTLLAFIQDPKICTKLFIATTEFLKSLCDHSFKYVSRMSSEGYFNHFIANKSKIILDDNVLNALFSFMCCHIIEYNKNIEDEQIVIAPLISVIFKFTLGTEYYNRIISAMHYLSKVSVGNQYQFFKSNIIIEMISYLQDNYSDDMIETPILSHISTSFFHKKELRELLKDMVKPPMRASQFFVTLINLILYQQTKSDRSPSFFHVTGQYRGFEKFFDAVEFPFSAYISVRFLKSEGLILALFSQSDCFKVSYKDKKLIFVCFGDVQEVNFEIKPSILYNIGFKMTAKTIIFEVNRVVLFDYDMVKPMQGRVTCNVGGIFCDIEQIVFENGNNSSKYTATLTKDYFCTDLNSGKVDAVFKGLIIPFTPTLSSTLINCGGPTLIIPIFEATPFAPEPNSFLLACLDLILQMSNRLQSFFIHQKMFRSLNAVFRKLNPKYFSISVVTKILALGSSFTNPKIKNEIESFICGDPSLFFHLAEGVQRQHLHTESPYSELFVVANHIAKNFEIPNFEEKFNTLVDIFSNDPFTFNDASTLILVLNEVENLKLAELLLKFIKNKIESNEILLTVLSHYHFYMPFVRFFKYESLEVLSLDCITRIERKTTKSENIELLNAMQSIVRIIAKPIETMFDIIISRISEEKPCYSYLPLICKLIEHVDRNKQKAALYIIRIGYEKFEKPFTGWITYMLFLAQLDDVDSYLWMPILARIIANNMKLLSTLLLLFDITVKITGLDYDKCFDALTGELSKSTISYHVADKDSLICLMRWVIFKLNINLEGEPHIFTSFEAFIETIKNLKISYDDIDIFEVDQKKRSTFVIALLKACAYGGGLTFNNIELRTLFISLFISIKNLNHDLAIDVSEYLTYVASNSSNYENFRIPALIINEISGELNEKYEKMNEMLDKMMKDGPQPDISHDKQHVIQLNDETYHRNITAINKMLEMSVKTDLQLQEEMEISNLAGKPISHIIDKIRSTIKRKHAEADFALSKNSATVKGGTISLFREGEDMHYSLSDTIDSFGRHARMKPIKNFNDHSNAVYQGQHIDTVERKFIPLDKEILEEKLAETGESFQCSRVTPKYVHTGTVFVLKKSIIFEGKTVTEILAQVSYENPKFVEISLSEVTHVLWRRYQLIDTALEMFTKTGQIVFFVFHDAKKRMGFIEAISKSGLPSAVVVQRKEKIDISRLTKLWIERVISNYEYIYWLNMYAGRSFLDVSQYPVFPWVIKDYKSDSLNLEDENIYRDLSQMIGALNETRLKRLKENVEDSPNEFTPLYLSLFSNAGFAANFMIRVEPFTTMAIDLQGGHFDNPNRIFFDVAMTWDHVTSEQSDFRELIPEFFTTSAIFDNRNNYNLGISDDGIVINDVILPSWAKNSFEFVRKNRLALESPYVSEHINDWIDLFFGVNRFSFKHNNVFCTYSYPEYIDVKDDLLVKNAMNFGIMTSKIFDEPHPKRSSSSLFMKSFSLNENLKLEIEKSNLNVSSVIAVAFDSNLIFTLDKQGKLSTTNVLNFEDVHYTTIPNFYGEKTEFCKHCFINTPGHSVFYTTPWRTDFDIFNFTTKHKTENVQNTFLIPCINADGDFAVIGSIDSTVTLIHKDVDVKHIVGHSSPIVDAVVSQRCGYVASIDSSNTLLLSNLDCTPFAQTKVTVGTPQKVFISELGAVVVIGSLQSSTVLEVYSEECSLICREVLQNTAAVAACIAETHDCGSFVILCGGNRLVTVFRVLDLKNLASVSMDAKVSCIDFSKLQNKAIMLLENDEVIFMSLSL